MAVYSPSISNFPHRSSFDIKTDTAVAEGQNPNERVVAVRAGQTVLILFRRGETQGPLSIGISARQRTLEASTRSAAMKRTL